MFFNKRINFNQSEDAEYHVNGAGIEKLKNVGIELIGTVMSDGKDYQVFKIPKSNNSQPTWKVYRSELGKCAGRSQGRKVGFCTIAEYDAFKTYINKDDMYLFYNISDIDSPYQFHYKDNQFMNSDDEEII